MMLCVSVMDFTLAQDTLPTPVDSTEASVNESSLNLGHFTHGLKMSIGTSLFSHVQCYSYSLAYNLVCR